MPTSHLIDSWWLLWWCRTGENAGQAGIHQWTDCCVCSLRSRRPYKIKDTERRAEDGQSPLHDYILRTSGDETNSWIKMATSSSLCNRSGSCSRPCWTGSWDSSGSLFYLNHLVIHTLNALYLKQREEKYGSVLWSEVSFVAPVTTPNGDVTGSLRYTHTWLQQGERLNHWRSAKIKYLWKRKLGF